MGFLFLFLILFYLLACVGLAYGISKNLRSRLAKVSTWVVVMFLAISFFLSRLLPEGTPECIQSVIYAISTTWLLYMLYGSMLMILLYIGRWVMRIAQKPVKPIGLSTFVAIFLAVTTLLIAGYINAVSPRIVNYHVGLNGKRIVAVSDIHMGHGVGKSDVEKLVNIVNEQNADMCIIAGDLFDGDIAPVINGDLGAAMRNVNCPIVAVMGNHEYIGGDPDRDAEYLRGLGMNVLRDSAIVLNGYTIVGRDDVSGVRFKGLTKSIKEIVPDSLMNNLIVVDHQPYRIDESVENGAVLHISGHTHAGQVWPMRIFTSMIYKLDYGMERFGGTAAIVTSGYGTWGPRVRLKTVSEVVVID